MKNELILIFLLIVTNIYTDKLMQLLAIKKMIANIVLSVSISVFARYFFLMINFLLVDWMSRIFHIQGPASNLNISEMELSIRAIVMMVIFREALDIWASEMKYWKVLLIMIFITCIVFVVSHFWIPAFLIQKVVKCLK